MLWALKKAFKDGEYKIITASDGLEAIDIVLNSDVDLILLDLRMPKADGMEVLRKIREKNIKIPVVMITAHGTMESAIEAMKLGAMDYISKPFNIDELKIVIKNALNIGNMQEKIELLTEELNSKLGKTIVYKSEKMKSILDVVNKVADSNATLLITIRELEIIMFIVVACITGALVEKEFKVKKLLEDQIIKITCLENYTKNILDSILNGVIAIDKNLKVTSINKEGKNILGYQDIDDKYIYEFFQSKEIVRNLLKFNVY